MLYGGSLAIFERLNMFKMFELFMRVTDSKGESLLMIRMQEVKGFCIVYRANLIYGKYGILEVIFMSTLKL